MPNNFSHNPVIRNFYRNYHNSLPSGWAFDPEAEPAEIIDRCPNCGAEIDDDTEVFFYADASGEAYIGCEFCVISRSAREAQDKGYAHFREYIYDNLTHDYHAVSPDDA